MSKSGDPGLNVIIDVQTGVGEELDRKGYPLSVKLLESRVRKWTTRILGRLVPRPVEVSVLLVADPAMRELNSEWRGVFRVTDVLSFPQLSHDDLTNIQAPGENGQNRFGEEPPLLLGDIVIAPATVFRRAGSKEVFWQDLGRVLVHGLLHLMGWNHKKAGDRKKMRVEEDVLRRLLR